MTLGDTGNGLMMLKMYTPHRRTPRRKITYNLLVTGVGIISGLMVGVIAVATLLTEQAGLNAGFFNAIASINTEYAGFLLAALFAVIGISAWILWRRSSPTTRP